LQGFGENDDYQQPRTKEDDSMGDVDERSDAMRGSQPVAWSVDWDGEIDCDFVYRDRESAMEVIADNDDTSGVVVPLYREPRPALTDEERVDVAMWLSECLRQCSLATDGGSEEVAERWRNRSERAAQMLERLR
jgi:hypothetical protein